MIGDSEQEVFTSYELRKGRTTMGIIDRTEVLRAGFSRLRQYARHSTGRMLGTVASSAGAYMLLLERLESRHFHRVELNALAVLLVEKGVFTEAEWSKTLEDEIKLYESHVASDWSEIKPASDGRSYTLDAKLFQKRVERESWPT